MKKFNGRDALPRVHNRKPKPDAEHRVPAGSGFILQTEFFHSFGSGEAPGWFPTPGCELLPKPP